MTDPTSAPEVAGRVPRLSEEAQKLLSDMPWQMDTEKIALAAYIAGLEEVASTAQRAVAAWFHDEGPTECEEWPAVVFDLRAALAATDLTR